MDKISGKVANPVGFIAFAALMLGHASQGLTFVAFTPGLPQMARAFDAQGNGMEIAQQSVTIAALGIVIGAVVSGKVVDMLGSRATMLTMLALFGISGLGGLVLTQPWPLLASRVVNGFASACLLTACINTVSILFDGNARAKAIGTAGAVGSAASLVGLLLGGLLVQSFGWRASFIQFPIFGAAGLLLTFIGIRDSAPAEHLEMTEIYSWRSIFPLLILTTVIGLLMFMTTTQVAFILTQDGVVAATTISLVMATITVVGVLSAMNYGVLERRLGLQPTLALAFAAGGGALALIGFATSLPMAFAGSALFGVYSGISSPYTYHAVTLKTPPHARAKAIGLIGAFFFLGAFINPFVLNPMTKLLGLHDMFIIMGGVMGVMALGTILQSRIWGRSLKRLSKLTN